MIGLGVYNLEHNEPKYTGYTYDRDTNETDSDAKKDIETWYDEVFAGTTYDKLITGGRFCSDSSGYKTAPEYGNLVVDENTYLYASYDRLGQSMTGYAKANVPTLKCPTTTESYGGSYRLKAGLITADELVLAGESFGVVGNSYLNPGESEIPYWTMTPTDFNGGSAYVWRVDDYLGYDNVNSNAININESELRPVINVTTDNGFISGDGTASSPYVIS